MSEGAARVGVLVMAHGTPDSPGEIEAFYTRIRRGRPPTPEQLDELTGRYAAIGGTSPLTRRTRAQVDGLSAALEAMAPDRFAVRLGTKYVQPSIEEAVADLADLGVDRVVGIVLTPHQSTLGSGEYFTRARAAASEASRPLELTAIPSWHRAPGFAPILAGRTRTVLDAIDPAARAHTVVFFTAHSLPQRAVAQGDPYPVQVGETATDIADLLDLDADPTVTWGTAWQSAGRTPDPWIGPDLLSEMERVASVGATAVVVCPVGFVSDHLEILYDLDIEAQAKADSLGIVLARTPSLDDDPAFLAILAEVVRDAADGADVSDDGIAGRPVVAVIGGGMAGLAAAWQLSQDLGEEPGRRPHVVVLEASDRLGGKVHASEFCGRTVDVAADAFLARRPEATELCSELGLDEALIAPGATGAALWARGRLRMMPVGLNLGVPTQWWPLARAGILSPVGAARAAADLVRPHRADPGSTDDRAVGEVVQARLGRQVVERLVDPLVGGIHAGGVDDLSAQATFPPLLAADRQSGSLMKRLRLPTPPPGDPSVRAPIFWSLEGSTARLPAELVAALAARKVAVHTGVTVEALSRAAGSDRDHRTWKLTLAGDTSSVLDATGGSGRARTLAVDGVVLAVPADRASLLLADHAPRAASILGDVRSSSVSVVTLSIPSRDIRSELVGTGFLVPRTSPVNGGPALVTGCTYLSRKWPGLARPDDELIRLSVGRFGDDRPQSMDDDELTRSAFGELTAILDIVGAPGASMVTRWDRAFPQYEPGHLERIDQVEEAVAGLPGIGVAGNAYRGVGIPAVVGSGRAAARAMLRSLDEVRRATPA